ncbi:MAG: SCO family protein [Bradyrhizobium sp.]|uniref:SCO family protein n=1 Tax=Bradyrhizobium sp. TaxID=376 RepID=UPI0025C4E65F|nr:SCO family protein [Bradyrhizobium sp.]MBI5262101.1 SCO family protein [Bradyrhizobium sp.]
MSDVARSIFFGLAVLTLLEAFGPAVARAEYFRRPESDLNPAILQIDERAVLGRAIDPATELVDHAGKVFRWGDLAGKPTLLVLSYYTCDGSCAVINENLHDLLKQMTGAQPGTDFNLVTLSFDRRDDLKSTDAFRKQIALADGLAPVWTFATFKNEADLKAQTEKIGFKFFWSPQDRIFLHPGVYLFFSPEGRLARILYQQDIDAKDVQLAVLDAREGQFKVSEIASYALSLCYSYNYQDGKYRLSIPVFVGAGAFAMGILTFAGSALVFRMRRQTQS